LRDKNSREIRPQVFELLQLLRGSSTPGHHGQSPEQAMAPIPRQLTADQVNLVVSDRDDGLGERIEAELGAFNAEMTGLPDPQPLRVTIWDGDDLLAGLCGTTWGGCGYIDLIWVRADYRRRGLGTRLLGAGEKEIRLRGCDQVALATYSFQAPAFYIRAGYTERGRRSDFPHGHDQILLMKALS
jgi:GNAT superfamily N-acetyltransferase